MRRRKKKGGDIRSIGSVRGPPDLSPWDYKVNNYNPVENSQPNTQTLLRDLHIKASEVETRETWEAWAGQEACAPPPGKKEKNLFLQTC